MLKSLALVTVPIMAMLWPSSPAQAASDAVCDAYAASAVRAAEEVRKRSCKFDLNHPQWSTNYDTHLQWCLRSNLESVDHEANERTTQLSNCQNCDTYATRAVAAQILQSKLSCDFSGPAWSTDRQGHLDWCLASRSSSVENEQNARELWAHWCEECSSYATKAEQQAIKGRACFRSGAPSWSIDKVAHFKSCLTLGPDRFDALNSENDARERALQACAARTQAPLTVAPKAETFKRVPRDSKRAVTKRDTDTAVSRKKDTAAAPAARQRSGGSGSSAMDRLGGGTSSSPSGTAGGGAVNAGRPRGSTARAPDSSGGGGGVAPPATSVNRNAIGGAGSSERLR